jgi:hypothetical protein
MLENEAKPGQVTREKPKPVLWVKFTGGQVSLERISLSVLSRTLSAIGKLSPSVELRARPVTGEPPDPGAFQLLGAKTGSAIYTFGGVTSGLHHLSKVGRAIERPERAEAVNFNIGAIEDLSTVSARLKCSIVIYCKVEGGRRAVLVRIGPDTFRQVRDTLTIRGETSIYGTLKRVGGATRMSCTIRLPSREKLLYCRVQNADLSRKLGRFLYEPVTLTGEATWLRSNWSIAGFLVRSISQPKHGKLVEAFDEVREAGGHAWDNIADPEAFLDDDRRGE